MDTTLYNLQTVGTSVVNLMGIYEDNMFPKDKTKGEKAHEQDECI